METRHLDHSLFKIDSWAKILRGSRLFPNNKGYNLLIKGLPGTGKTSLGLSILHKVCEERRAKARLVTFVEPLNQILELIGLFPWNFRKRLDIVETTLSNLDILGFLEDEALGTEIQYLMIDGISILKYQTRGLKPRTKKLIDCLKERKLSTILISEEAVPGEDRFFEYLVDGIINLTVKGADRQRFLEISKMRYSNYAPGKHGFDFRKSLPPHDNKIDIQIYPSIKCYLEDEAVDQDYKSISSSIEGFDRLITGSSKVPFDPGDVVLVMGEPSSGKTLFSLEFINGIQKGENNQEIGVWISLEEDLEGFKKYTKLFSENKKLSFTQLLENDRFKFIYFDPSRFRLDEFSSAIMVVLQNYKVTRLVIDSLSILERKFQTSNEWVEYLSSLLRTIKKRKPVSLLTYGISKYFQTLGNLEISHNPDVDIIIHLRNYDMNNNLVKALEVIKSRGKEYNSLLQSVEITRENGLILKEQGWARVGLLAGKPENISEARLFFKYFYQNYSTQWIDKVIFDSFANRYSKNETFKMVGRTHPSPDHWSFQGYGGPGHSNTKVVCLKKYIMDRLRDTKKVFVDVPKDVLGDNIIARQLRSDSLWKDNIGGKNNSQMIPIYADLGVLCYQPEYSTCLFGVNGYPDTWNDLLDWTDRWRDHGVLKGKIEGSKEPSQGITYLFVMPSLATDLGNFMGFFLEILGAHGGSLFPCKEEENWSYSTHNKKDNNEFFIEHFRQGIENDAFLETLFFLRDLVKKKVCPDPRQGAHYHCAIFSRRWYSKIDQYPEGDEKRPGFEKAIRFSIAPLPKVKKDKGSVSALEIYCAGIIKGALAPETGWMFIKELVSFEADTKRINDRRGIPIDRKLCLSTKEKPEREEDFSKVIRKILGIEGGRPSIIRNTDIPYYYDIENLIAPEIENIFDKDDSALKEIQLKILNKVIGYFAPSSSH